jgi:hypothetical protein
MVEIKPSANTSAHRYFSPEAWKGVRLVLFLSNWPLFSLRDHVDNLSTVRRIRVCNELL